MHAHDMAEIIGVSDLGLFQNVLPQVSNVPMKA